MTLGVNFAACLFQLCAMCWGFLRDLHSPQIPGGHLQKERPRSECKVYSNVVDRQGLNQKPVKCLPLHLTLFVNWHQKSSRRQFMVHFNGTHTYFGYALLGFPLFPDEHTELRMSVYIASVNPETKTLGSLTVQEFPKSLKFQNQMYSSL